MAGEQILIVEDESLIALELEEILVLDGYQVVGIVSSGNKAVHMAGSLMPDLILMDIRLPYEDGYQALQKVRGNPRLKETVVCAVTAEASEDQMRRAQKAGFDGFLGKPLDPDRFPSQITRLLSGEEVWEWT